MKLSPRVTIVSDTVDDINGVAIGLRRLVAAATRAGHVAKLVGPARPNTHAGWGLPPAGSGAEWRRGSIDEIVRIPAALTAQLPFYKDMTWSVPELPALVAYLSRATDIVQVATPGPMGIAGLIAARMLKLPVIAQYHTEVADYAAFMTGMPFVRELVSPIVGWFYQQADVCLAPSAAVEARLTSLGVPAARMQRVARGCDLELFSPAKRADLGFGEQVALYVGRLSKEKNLDTLSAAWKLVHATHPEATLLVVGDGPYTSVATGPNVIALGPKHGDELAALFASADVFAFPSETETFGNVVVEAAASGLPVVVAAAGAAHEHVVDGVTGDVCEGRDPVAIARAISRQFDDRPRRERMGAAAREHAMRFDLGRAMESTWALYETVLGERALERAS
jgi:glycosyltransferase involved in cell wall biosynthesis